MRSNFPDISHILGEFISVQIHAAPVFAPARIQENIPGELFMYWFRARGYCAGVSGISSVRKALDTFQFLRHVVRAIWSV